MKQNRTNHCDAGRITVSGAGCVRADRYGTLEVDGHAVVPELAGRLAEQVGENAAFAGRVTLTVELWGQPLQCRTLRQGGGR